MLVSMSTSTPLLRLASIHLQHYAGFVKFKARVARVQA
jgi:hypothetical protein